LYSQINAGIFIIGNKIVSISGQARNGFDSRRKPASWEWWCWGLFLSPVFDLGQEMALCSQTIPQNVCRFAKNVISLHRQSARVLVT